MSAAVRKARPPAGLGEAGRAVWNKVAGQVAEDGLVLDARDLRLLREAAVTADELDRLELALAEAPTTVPGSMGQVRVQPLFDEVRKTRALFARLLSQIDLSDPAAGAHGTGQGNPGNPGVHRAAAHARWRSTIRGLPGVAGGA